MFCPECGAEYRAGFTVCADCEVDLVERLDGLAATSDLAFLHATRDPDELADLVERLEEARVPYLVQAGTALALAEGGTLAGGEPDGWGARLAVHGPRLDEGHEILRAVQAARR